MTFDLGTIAGKIDLDLESFDRKYAQVEAVLRKLEQAKIPDVRVDIDTDRAATRVDQFVGDLSGIKDASVDVTADTSRAEAAVDAVEGALETMSRRDYDPKIDVDITRSQTRVDSLRRELEVLSRMESSPKVTADIDKAQRELQSAESRLKALDGIRAEMTVTADTSRAESALKDIGDTAVEEGETSGRGMGDGMVAGIIAGLAAIPIVGAVVGVGAAIGKGLVEGVKDGFQLEVTQDIFSARTGLDEATAARFATAAGNAYANAFGESMETNLDRARYALQVGLIDTDATQTEIERVMAQLDVLVTVSEEDANRISTAVDVMLSTGVARSAEEAFDVLTAGFQNGVNSGEDLLDTFIEYPAVLERLGLDAETAMGLMNQGLEGGARNADFVADALKEFQIRATDASDASAAGYERIGLNAEKMTAQIAAGGEGARDGLELVLDKLREMEDPVERNAAGVELFGTKWEDLGSAMLNLDVSTAVSSLGQVEGALDTAMSKIADNPATAIDSAVRNIEIAGDGVKAALAVSVAEPLEELATWVQGNRSGVIEVLGDWANATFDMGRAGVEAVASMIEAFGDFIGVTIPDAMLAAGGLLDLLGQYGIIDFDVDAFDQAIFAMRDTRWTAYETAEGMRTSLIDEGIDPIQARFNEGLDTQILQAQVHDSSVALQGSIGDIGSSLEDLDDVEIGLGGKFSHATDAGALLDGQLRDAVASIGEVQGAAAAAGESQESLTDRWNLGRDALVAQIEALGYTTEEAVALAEAYGAVPEQIATSADLETAPAITKLGELVVEVDSASGTVTVNGDKTPADATLGSLVGNIDTSDGTVTINGNKVPADLTLDQLLGVIGGSRETVTINGQDFPAKSVLGGLMQTVSSSRANVNIGANTYSATSALDSMLRTYNGRTMTVYTMIKTIGQAPVATGGDVDAHARAAASAANSYALGGAVYGPGTGTSDDVPATHPSGVAFALSNGEHVLTADDVLDLGGQQGAYALRAMIQSGRLRDLLEETRGLRDGGPVGPVPSSTSSAGSPSGPSRIVGELRLTGDGRAFVVGTLERNLRDVASLNASASGFYSERMVTP